MKKLLITVLIIIITILSIAVFKFNFAPLPVGKVKPEIELNYPASYQLTNVPTQYLRQTPYDCGEYNVYFVMQIFPEPITEEVVKKEIKKSKIRKLGVLPETLVNFFNDKTKEVRANLISVKKQTDEQKIETIKQILSNAEKPVIVLVKRHGYLHYLTVIGYDRTHLHVYDPMIARDGDSDFTQDLNGATVGNDSIADADFLNLWSQGNVLGVYKNVFIQFD